MSRDTWSIEYHRELADRQRGDLNVSLYGNRVFSHGFLEPEQTFFENNIPAAGKVELVVSITQSADAVWGSNPMGETVDERIPPRLGLILGRDWHSPYGRWFSVLRIDVQPGIHRIMVPVKPALWKSVFGEHGHESKQAKEMFRKSWTKPARIGVCGGGQFHAHGLEMLAGTGTFRVLALRVRP